MTWDEERWDYMRGWRNGCIEIKCISEGGNSKIPKGITGWDDSKGEERIEEEKELKEMRGEERKGKERKEWISSLWYKKSTIDLKENRKDDYIGEEIRNRRRLKIRNVEWW